MKKTQQVKGYKTQISKLEAEVSVVKQEIKIKRDELQRKEKHIAELHAKIKKLQNKGGLKVSEHAIVRYLERVKGIDMEQLENEIANDQVKELVTKFKQGTFPAGNFSVVVKDNTVITIQN